jgi:hypothetical protein
MRMLERIVVVLGGVLSMYLGFRLFQVKAAVAEFSVSRVGPGVFFAFFGCLGPLHISHTRHLHANSRAESACAPLAC